MGQMLPTFLALCLAAITALPGCAPGQEVLRGLDRPVTEERRFLDLYSVAMAQKDTFVVVFNSDDPIVSDGVVARFALVKAAQAALDNGYPFITIVSGIDNVKILLAADGRLGPYCPDQAKQNVAVYYTTRAVDELYGDVSIKRVLAVLGLPRDPGDSRFVMSGKRILESNNPMAGCSGSRR